MELTDIGQLKNLSNDSLLTSIFRKNASGSPGTIKVFLKLKLLYFTLPNIPTMKTFLFNFSSSFKVFISVSWHIIDVGKII